MKFEFATPDKPEIVSIAGTLGIDQDAVVGKMLRIWAWADTNSIDGACMNVTEMFLDRLTYQPGFAKAMRAAGWLKGQDGALVFPNFDRHNGTTAKARAMANRRNDAYRAGKKRAPKIAVPKAAPPPQASTEDEVEPPAPRPLPVVRDEFSDYHPPATAAHLESLLKRVNSLSPDWAKVHPSYEERRTLIGSAGSLESLDDETWTILTAFMAAVLPQGCGLWQPKTRSKFLQSPADVVAHAMEWNRNHRRARA